MNALKLSWLGSKLYKTIRGNPKIKLVDIVDKAHEKWNTGINKKKTFKARKRAFDLVDGFFLRNNTRLYMTIVMN